jgi:hypothetical protein
MRLQETQSLRGARLEGWAATDLGFTRDRHQICASRVNPTCDVRDAAHEGCGIWVGL